MPKDMLRQVNSCGLDAPHGRVVVGIGSEVYDDLTREFTKIVKIVADDFGNHIIFVESELDRGRHPWELTPTKAKDGD
jgi:hypothetical protein